MFRGLLKMMTVGSEAGSNQSERPTNGQLKYAKQLGLKVPKGADYDTVQTLIDRATDRPSERRLKKARSLGIDVPAELSGSEVRSLIEWETIRQQHGEDVLRQYKYWEGTGKWPVLMVYKAKGKPAKVIGDVVDLEVSDRGEIILEIAPQKIVNEDGEETVETQERTKKVKASQILWRKKGDRSMELWSIGGHRSAEWVMDEAIKLMDEAIK